MTEQLLTAENTDDFLEAVRQDRDLAAEMISDQIEAVLEGVSTDQVLTQFGITRTNAIYVSALVYSDGELHTGSAQGELPNSVLRLAVESRLFGDRFLPYLNDLIPLSREERAALISAAIEGRD